MRFVSPDPLAIHQATGDLNPYEYANGSPFRYTDPTGLDGTSNDEWHPPSLLPEDQTCVPDCVSETQPSSDTSNQFPFSPLNDDAIKGMQLEARIQQEVIDEHMQQLQDLSVPAQVAQNFKTQAVLNMSTVVGGELLSAGALAGLGAVFGEVSRGAPQLAHLTNSVSGASIDASGIINGPIYASTLGTAAQMGVTYTMRSGVLASDVAVGFAIPDSALVAFARPVPMGVLSGQQFFGGTYFTSAGALDLATGVFVRTGINWNQAVIYGIDATIDMTALGAAYYSAQQSNDANQ
jgi:hypothetical protein